MGREALNFNVGNGSRWADRWMNIPLIDQEYILKPFGMVCASLLELELQARCHSSYLFSLIFMDMLLMSIDISIKIVPKKK